jgi:hypothetical protein
MSKESASATGGFERDLLIKVFQEPSGAAPNNALSRRETRDLAWNIAAGLTANSAATSLAERPRTAVSQNMR